MPSLQQKGLSSNRVRSTPGAYIDHLECCVCHDLLWKPVACQMCETPFCSACINQWLTDNPNKCPNRCETYIERKCPPFIAKLLAQLQIACFYESNGCEQVIQYEALEKHEIGCGFQLQQCSGCQSSILKKDFDIHKNGCASIELTCQECQLVYKRGDADTKHSENICSKEQLRQLRDESKRNKREIQKLTDQLNELCILNPSLIKAKIIFNDLPSAVDGCKYIPDMYKKLKWTNIRYMHDLYAMKNHPTSGYVNSFVPGGSQHIAVFNQDASIYTEISNETFTLVSVSACAAWNDNLQLTITGYRKSTEINVHREILIFGKPQLILLHWKNIDHVLLSPSGGTPHPGSRDTGGVQVVLTQLTISQPD